MEHKVIVVKPLVLSLRSVHSFGGFYLVLYEGEHEDWGIDNPHSDLRKIQMTCHAAWNRGKLIIAALGKDGGYRMGYSATFLK
jgi:hypothetical protein